jgi:hypothetical protein
MRDNTKEILPNRIVSEAPRCGTTGLHYCLGLDPGISMSRPKQPGSNHVYGAWGQTR